MRGLAWLFSSLVATPPTTTTLPKTRDLSNVPKYDPSVYKAGAAARRVMGGSILIDVENVRGKSGFCLSHHEIIESMAAWTQLCQLDGQISLVVDHGSEASAFYMEDSTMSVVFAGPTRKADDLIATDVAFLGQRSDVMVVTADRELIHRCRRAAVKASLHIMTPVQLLEDLELILKYLPVAEEDDTDSPTTSDSEGVSDSETEEQAKLLEHEIKLGAELLEAEAMLKAKAGVNNKRKGKLKAKVQSLREKLAKSPAMLNRVTDVLRKGRRSSMLDSLAEAQQQALLKRWEKVRQKSNRKERTGDRVILAEHLRRQLEKEYGEATRKLVLPETDSSGTAQTAPALNMAMLHVNKINAKRIDVALPTATDSLRVVLVSDTHGHEEALGNLPEADVLLHLGDFAIDRGNKKLALDNFDKWLARQPQPCKIVVRGNHDPRTWYPAESGATFITKPTTLTVAGFVFAFIPHVSTKVSRRLLPRRCDVLATHVPPRDILDKCYSGKHAGSSSIRKGVEKMRHSAPVLWVCGHIHEARGAVRHSFGAASDPHQPETLVINAANANAGIAKRVDHGPAVVQLNSLDPVKHKKNVELVSMDNQFTFLNTKQDGFFRTKPAHKKQFTELLLAVDLGLRTGLALFNERGELLRYVNEEYDSPETLREEVSKLLDHWESDVSSENEECSITHVAVEGADVRLRDVWRDLASDMALLFVRPEEWRADLLTSRERVSGQSSKDAARHIARQIVADCSGKLHEGKFRTDVAEAILVGFHICRRLGWNTREPAIRRYTNGKVVVPSTVVDIAVSFSDESESKTERAVQQVALV